MLYCETLIAFFKGFCNEQESHQQKNNEEIFHINVYFIIAPHTFEEAIINKGTKKANNK